MQNKNLHAKEPVNTRKDTDRPAHTAVWNAADENRQEGRTSAGHENGWLTSEN